jgi:hypothetical protein
VYEPVPGKDNKALALLVSSFFLGARLPIPALASRA